MKKLLATFIVAGTSLVSAQTSSTFEPATLPVLQIKAGTVIGNVSPTLYGLMTEEINFSYEGGLYAELIRNRTFKATPAQPRGRAAWLPLPKL